MGLLDRFRTPEPAAPPPGASRRRSAAPIPCSCGTSFASQDKLHAHLHAEHPEHRH